MAAASGQRGRISLKVTAPKARSRLAGGILDKVLHSFHHRHGLIQMKECREFISRAEHRVAKLEADAMAEKNLLEEGRARLSRLEQQSKASPPPVVPSSRVAELEQQINALVQERDAFRAAAIPTKKRGPVTPRPP